MAYQDALTQISNSGEVYIESLSGKLNVANTKSLKIDRLLSCKDGIDIVCEKINTHIVIESGTGSIQCLKESKDVLREKIKLGKMHKGRLDFDVENDSNPAYSRVLVCLWAYFLKRFRVSQLIFVDKFLFFTFSIYDFCFIQDVFFTISWFLYPNLNRFWCVLSGSSQTSRFFQI